MSNKWVTDKDLADMKWDRTNEACKWACLMVYLGSPVARNTPPIEAVKPKQPRIETKVKY